MTNPYEAPEETTPPPRRRPRRGRLRSHNGVLILIFGILGLVVCMPMGIAAWIMGHLSLREMRQGRMDPSGRGLAMTGMILGIIACALAALGLVSLFLIGLTSR